jgi:hypothetical protein
LEWGEYFLEKKKSTGYTDKKYWLHLDIIIVRVKEKQEKCMEILLLFSLVILLAEVYLATIQLQQLYIYNFSKKKLRITPK